ncbi:hypothetical protein SMGD1_1223 [Sulfurimonas gotlandica GD1]|uniref:DUF3373 domain-containing protein n=1 Tax=Sulfurimonas gotlandica (strain DSM 19862 / JCM 16533 / GD1) TaxID=929558 RepID=B6BGW3_SULGG|nr:DUF3373 family protein [Sulfurimonas gotlandica]EDZ63787.1 conserved hypothetical protein [Sulfurimonas gotlandica GD1]EHP29747.1 hypothetical protein SMGD1_1223 [Sulfurimonas gotlandica GD1]
MKKIIALSTVAFLSTALYANADMQSQIDELTKKVQTLEKKQTKNTEKISSVNALAAKDNLKFDVDFRTSYDNIQYETVGKKKYSNDALYSNRLWLGMGYAPVDTMIFKGQLSFNKAFGASYAQRGTGHGFDTFDWVINENLTDDTLKVREAYWLWTPTVGGFPTTLSVGRRPATNGYLINLRDDDKAKSPMGHVINMEFDGASASVQLDKYVSGMYVKLCLGRGLTNAASWASSATYYAGGGGAVSPNYAEVSGALDNVDMLGVIFKPYDNGQYSLMTKYYRGFNVPGMVNNPSYVPPAAPTAAVPAMLMKSLGEMDGAAISGKIDGIGNEINDFLDSTVIFASFAWSQTRPDSTNAADAMLGSTEQKSGTSYWIGTQMPNMTGGKFGLEYNHGSKYWRPFTYGEDTMVGSKMATRGSAYEAYWTQPIIDDVFSMQIRYTYLDYDYSGSNGFFGNGGAPIDLSSSTEVAAAALQGSDPVKTAQDIRVYFRYRY